MFALWVGALASARGGAKYAGWSVGISQVLVSVCYCMIVLWCLIACLVCEYVLDVGVCISVHALSEQECLFQRLEV